MFFGLSKAVIASLILILSYAVLFSEKLNRAVAVMLGAAAMVLSSGKKAGIANKPGGKARMGKARKAAEKIVRDQKQKRRSNGTR